MKGTQEEAYKMPTKKRAEDKHYKKQHRIYYLSEEMWKHTGNIFQQRPSPLVPILWQPLISR